MNTTRPHHAVNGIGAQPDLFVRSHRNFDSPNLDSPNLDSKERAICDFTLTWLINQLGSVTQCPLIAHITPWYVSHFALRGTITRPPPLIVARRLGIVAVRRPVGLNVAIRCDRPGIGITISRVRAIDAGCRGTESAIIITPAFRCHLVAKTGRTTNHDPGRSQPVFLN